MLVVAHKVVSKAEGALRRADRRRRRRARARARARARQGPAPRAGHPRRVREVAARAARRAHLPHPSRLRVRQRGRRRLQRPRGRRARRAPARPRRVSARALRAALPGRPAVVVTDSFGRAWRHGQCDVAIGIAGLRAARRLARAPRPARPRAARHCDRGRRRGRGRRRPRARQGRRASRRSSSAASSATSPTTTARARPRSCARSPRTSSAEPRARAGAGSAAQAHDALAAHAARRLDLDLVARAAAHQRLGHRRLGRELARPTGRPRSAPRSCTSPRGRVSSSATVTVVPKLTTVGVGRASTTTALRRRSTQALDLGLQVRLVLLGDVVLGVLLEVAELARGHDALAPSRGAPRPRGAPARP